PLVLCYLEGHTQDEAARQLGWTRGTVRGRLNRGRERLRARLVGRGLALTAGTVVTTLSARTALAGVSAGMADSVSQAPAAFAASPARAAGLVSPRVASLAEGATRAMFFTKARIATVILFVVGLSAWGLGTLTHPAQAQRTSAPAAGAAAQAPAPNAPPIAQ